MSPIRLTFETDRGTFGPHDFGPATAEDSLPFMIVDCNHAGSGRYTVVGRPGDQGADVYYDPGPGGTVTPAEVLAGLDTACRERFAAVGVGEEFKWSIVGFVFGPTEVHIEHYPIQQTPPKQTL